MRVMLAQMFGMFTMFFQGFSNLASAFVRVTGVVDRSADIYAQQLEMEHQAKMEELQTAKAKVASSRKRLEAAA